MAHEQSHEQKPVLEHISKGHLRGFAAFGAVLELLQVAVQRVYSITLVKVFAYHPSNGGSSTISCTQHRIASIAATVFVHAALFLFPAIFITLLKPSPHEFGTGLLVGFTTIANTWAGFVFVLLQFLPQYLEMRRVSAIPGSLSLLSPAPQAVIILAVANRWLLRLGPTTWGDQAARLWYWDQWGALPSTYIIHALGCAIWLALYLVTGRAGEEVVTF